MQIHNPIPPSRSQRLFHKVVVRASGLHNYSTALGERKLSAKSANSGNSANLNIGIRDKSSAGHQLVTPEKSGGKGGKSSSGLAYSLTQI